MGDLSDTTKVRGVVVIVALLILSVLVLVNAPRVIEEEKSFKVAIEEDYTFYLDGVVVDESTLNLRDYWYEVNVEDKFVILTEKVYSTPRNYIPVPVPVIKY